jgi:hypothetical protein
MTQLGAGFDSSYPAAIDTRQFFQNAAAAAPDSSSRVDAEVLNDLLSAVIAIETTLGANPQGVYGSLAQRLAQFLPGGGGTPGAVGFNATLNVTVSGTMRATGAPAVFVRVYDNATPHYAIQPGTVTVTTDQLVFTLDVTFGVSQSGLLVVSTDPPQFVSSFLSQTTVAVTNSTHQLNSSSLIVQLYDTDGRAIESQTLTVHPTTHDVVVTFGQPQSGYLVLGALPPPYVATFTNQTSVVVSGSTHAIGTNALLWQLYDNNVPARLIQPQSLSIHPSTYDVVVTFGQPQSGSLVLCVASALTGTEFAIRDAGIPDSTAVQVHSLNGNLYLQAGGSNYVLVVDRTGVNTALVVNTLTGNVGLGVVPAHRLHLPTDDAFKLTTSTWYTLSDMRLKEFRRRFTDGLDTVLQIEPLVFAHNGKGGIARDNKEHIGIDAHAVQQVAPYMVDSHPGQLDPEGPTEALLTFNAHALPFLLINAVKALHARVATLEAAVQDLRTGRA